MRYILVLLVLFLAVGQVSAGTLVSGSRVDVESNFQGFDGLSLVGTWSTTPAAVDTLVVKNSLLPDTCELEDGTEASCSLEDDITITVKEPVFEQVMTVTDQRPLYRATYYRSKFYYFTLTNDAAKEACDDAFQEHLNGFFFGKELYPGLSSLPRSVGKITCDVDYIVVDKHEGWVGTVFTSGTNYDQDIILDNGGTLELSSDKRPGQVTQLSDNIPNVAKATLLGFSDWTNAELNDDDIWAYHEREELGVGEWDPYEDSIGITTINNEENTILSIMGRAGTLTENEINEVTTALGKLDTEVSRIKGESFSLPSSWDDRFVPPVSSTANDIFVTIDPTKTVSVAEIQLILDGDSFGLIINVGEPKILSIDKTVELEETTSGFLDYEVQNVGEAPGAFLLEVLCQSQVVGDEETLNLDSGEKESGEIRITAKSVTGQDFDESCELRMTEISSGEFDSEFFTAEVTAKANCAEGEQTDPFPGGDNFFVNVLDKQCNLKDIITCPANTHEFVKEGSQWVCVERDGDGSIGGSGGGSDDGFNTVLFTIASILAVVGAGTVGFYTQGLRGLGTPGTVFWITLIVGTAVGVFLAVPALWAGIVGLF